MDPKNQADNSNRVIVPGRAENGAGLVFPSLDGPFVNWRSVSPGKVYHYSTHAPDQLAVLLAEELQDGVVVLDYGCGAGRHLRYLTKQGFELVGVDPGIGQLEVADQAAPGSRLEKLELGAALPLQDETIDGALSTWAIYHSTKALLLWSIDEILRTLKPGAPFFFNLISTADFKFGKGFSLEIKTFAETRKGSHGELHHFSDLKDVKEIVNRFSRATIRPLIRPLALEPYEEPVNDTNPVCAHWLIKAWK